MVILVQSRTFLQHVLAVLVGVEAAEAPIRLSGGVHLPSHAERVFRQARDGHPLRGHAWNRGKILSECRESDRDFLYEFIEYDAYFQILHKCLVDRLLER